MGNLPHEDDRRIVRLEYSSKSPSMSSSSPSDQNISKGELTYGRGLASGEKLMQV
jgi:heptaprenylglyceryl phosphate synthase